MGTTADAARPTKEGGSGNGKVAAAGVTAAVSALDQSKRPWGIQSSGARLSIQDAPSTLARLEEGAGGKGVPVMVSTHVLVKEVAETGEHVDDVEGRLGGSEFACEAMERRAGHAGETQRREADAIVSW